MSTIAHPGLPASLEEVARLAKQWLAQHLAGSA